MNKGVVVKAECILTAPITRRQYKTRSQKYRSLKQSGRVLSGRLDGSNAVCSFMEPTRSWSEEVKVVVVSGAKER